MKKSIIGVGIVVYALTGVMTSYAHKSEHPISESLHFIENKTQWPEEVKYRAGVPGGAVFITDKGFVYNYHSEEDLQRIHDMTNGGSDISNELVRYHAYRVNFIGANKNIAYDTIEKRPFYHNYFIGNDRSKWAGGVSLYGRVVQRNVYDGIDVAIYSSGQSLKYDFIVAPGADVDKIALSFEGVQPRLDDKGNLYIKTTVNEVLEQAPYVYQEIDGREVEVRCNYSLVKGRLSFHFPEGYSRNHPLVIDPQLVFATYSGGGGGTTGFYSYSTTYDAAGNLYAGSQAHQAGWPVTTGAFQAVYMGGQDVAINKYSSDGSALIYSTYYGGTGQDLPYAMIVNEQNELVVTGQTTSANLPYTTGCYDSTLGGARDIFVAHFNTTGTGLIGSTYVGGTTGNDIDALDMTAASQTAQHKTSPVEVICRPNGDIWVVSNTAASDFPVTPNALQPAKAGSSGLDVVLFRLNANCSQLLYSTYIGGTGNDVGFGIAFDLDGNVVICGGTQSNNFPVTSGVLINTAPGGSWDGFVTVVNPVTGNLLRSTYLGTNNTDLAIFLQIEPVTNYIYVMGHTKGDYPITPGAYHITASDIFIDVLSSDLTSSLRSTRLGNPQSGTAYAPSAFLLDICGNVYVAGLRAAAGLPLKEEVEAAQRPFWFGVLQKGFSDLLFASYFGTSADHSHVGVHRLDPAGVVYHSVCCNSTTYPTTTGVWAERKNPTQSGQDIISFKFNFDASGVRAGYRIEGGSDTGCAPFFVDFVNTSIIADTFLWDFGDGNFSTERSPVYTYSVPGTYRVSLYANNDSACVTHDTFQRVIVVYPSPQISVSGDTITCVNNPVQLHANLIYDPTVGMSIAWTPAAGLDNPSSTDPWASPLQDVTYKAVVTLDGGCQDEDSIHIVVIQGFELDNEDTAICLGETVVTRVTGDNRYTYTWTPSQGVSNTSAMAPQITPDSTRTYVVTATFPGCRDSIRSFEIDVQPVPTVHAGDDQILCFGDTLTLTPEVLPPDYPFYTYTWDPAGALDPAPNVPNPIFTGYQTATLTLTVTTPAGCTGNDDILLEVIEPDIIEASNDTLICPGDTIQLHVWGSQVSQIWLPSYYISDTLSADPYVYPVTSVTYTVYGRDIYNCLDTQSVHVRVLPAAVVSVPDSTRIFPGESYQLDPGGNCLYFEWFPPLGLSDHRISNPVAQPEVNTRYFVTGRTEDGCIARDSIDVYVNLDSYIDVPNAFAPGIGPNNVLRPVRRGHVTLKSFAVYNRWGVKMFETKNLDEGWDGSFNGAPQPMGVYVYVVEATTPTGREFRKQGNSTLLR